MQLAVVITALLAALINVEAAFQDYRAAVVEFGKPGFEITPDTPEDNVQLFRKSVSDAKKQRAQIVVFPEYALTNGPVDNPSNYATPVPDVGTLPTVDDKLEFQLIKTLSDIAQEHVIYLVVNLIEVYKEKNYNTAVVFNKSGVIVAKYRAINNGLHAPGLTNGPVDQPDSVFETDFGAKFGLISSFDIPANISNVPRLAKVTDLILTTSRNSYLPFQHTLSLQLGFALANNVNLLAASLSRPDEGIGGSGIYGGDGIVYSVFIAGRPSMKVLSGKIPANPVRTVTPLSPFAPQSLGSARPDAVPEITKFIASRLFSHKLYTTAVVNLTVPNIKSQVCHGKFCCNFEVNVTAGTYNNEHYRFLAFQGGDKLGERLEKLQLCGIVACESDDASSCATTNTKVGVVFDGLSVQYEGADGKWAQPVLLSKDLMPVTNSTFSVNFIEGKKNVILKAQEKADVILFGIMASGVETLGFSIILTVIMSSVCILFR